MTTGHVGILAALPAWGIAVEQTADKQQFISQLIALRSSSLSDETTAAQRVNYIYWRATANSI